MQDIFTADALPAGREQEPVFFPVKIKDAMSEIMNQQIYCVSIFANPSIEMRSYMLEVNGSVPPEIHPRSFQILQVLSGHLDVKLREATHHLRSGDFFQIPPNTQHELVNKSDGRTRYISTYTPAAHPPGEI